MSRQWALSMIDVLPSLSSHSGTYHIARRRIPESYGAY
jgi:hypothetical protein